jgi:hypothetical protein
LGELSSNDLIFVGFRGNVTATKADTIKSWTEPPCDVKSVNVGSGEATMITKDAAILTFKASADGTCGGSPVTPVIGTSLYVKEGDAWKLVFGFENPA